MCNSNWQHIYPSELYIHNHSPISTKCSKKIPQFHSPHPEHNKHQMPAIIKMPSLRQQKCCLCCFHSPTNPRENNPIAVTLHTWDLGTKTASASLHFHQAIKYDTLSPLLPHPWSSSMLLLPAAAAPYCAESSQAGAFAGPSVLPPLLCGQTKLLTSSLLGSAPSWSLRSSEFLMTGTQNTLN